MTQELRQRGDKAQTKGDQREERQSLFSSEIAVRRSKELRQNVSPESYSAVWNYRRYVPVFSRNIAMPDEIQI
jgi:hypothetical protein